MKTSAARFAILAVTGVLLASWILRAGNLDSPGPPTPPAPTMLTLDEIEPRIPVSMLSSAPVPV